MSDKIKELAKRLRDGCVQHSVMGPVAMRDAADALEAMAGEVERLTDMRQFKQNLTAELVSLTKQLAGANAAVTNLANELASIGMERDRLKAALEAVCAIAYDHGSIAAIAHARKALGGDA